MRDVAPDTLVRVSVAEAGSLSFEGGPGSVRLTYGSDGSTQESSSGVPVKAAPDLVTAEWEVSGVPAMAMIEVVATRYCTLEEIVSYRSDEFQLDELYGADSDEVWDARARAEEVIERSCKRALQPVMRTGFVDRPNCSTRTMVMGPDGYDPDASRIVSATGPGGSEAPVGIVNRGPYVDVSAMPYGSAAEVVYVSGLRAIPPEARGAVVALASWYLSPKQSPENATSASTEVGVISYVVGGVNGAATSIPEVNALIERFGRKDPKVA